MCQFKGNLPNYRNTYIMGKGRTFTIDMAEVIKMLKKLEPKVWYFFSHRCIYGDSAFMGFSIQGQTLGIRISADH